MTQYLNSWQRIREKLPLVVRTRLARFTAYLAAIEVVLIVLRWIMRVAGAASAAQALGGWINSIALVLSVLALVLALRWFRNHVMWSVRNRLIVTYLFIGVLPIALVLLIASLSAYFLAQQFAAYIPLSEIEAQSHRLLEVNSLTAGQSMRNASSSSISKEPLPEDKLFPGRTVSLLPDSQRPAWIKDGFHGLVVDQGGLYLRALSSGGSADKHVTVVSSVPIDKKFLSVVAADLGPITLFVPPQRAGTDNHINLDVNRGAVAINGKPASGISAGTLPPPQNGWDREFSYYSFIQPPDWHTGSPVNVLFIGTMRASSLYSRLAASASQWANVIFIVLGVLAGIFALIVVIAWLIGIRLTRTLTYSVANLYRATEHINRGDFNHRIQVRHKDQLGALQTAFNSMTDSLQKLIAEQKEKERLQSELEIAHEVQAQLFPQSASGTRTLEVCGTCRPARIVSGDYYDFLSYSPAQMGIAVGDIAGKGISAALLMATIHSAIRAYQQEQSLESGAGAAAYGTGPTLLTATASQIARPSPAETLWLLNRHLYQSTTPEKYATLFLGFYDDESRRLTYCNGGHLPPIVLGRDSSIRRLDVGGTVVGLFDFVEYDKQTVELYPGDLFIAFSDGMTEPENDYGEFGEDRLLETIASYRDLPLDRICEHAVAAVQDWIGSSEQPDDLTLVLARRTV